MVDSAVMQKNECWRQEKWTLKKCRCAQNLQLHLAPVFCAHMLILHPFEQKFFWTNILVNKYSFEQIFFWTNILSNKYSFERMSFWTNVLLNKFCISTTFNKVASNNGFYAWLSVWHLWYFERRKKCIFHWRTAPEVSWSLNHSAAREPFVKW